MNILNGLFEFLNKLLHWWFLVMPWEQAIFVRKGSKTKLLGPGLYFKIPFVDTVYVQTTRMRAIEGPMQTITTIDGTTVTIKCILKYSIDDVLKLYTSLFHPEITMTSILCGDIADYIVKNKIEDVTPSKIEGFITPKLDFVKYGIKDVSFSLTNFASVKTFRLIQENSYTYETLKMEAINVKPT